MQEVCGTSRASTLLANFVQHVRSVEERQCSNVAVLYKLKSDIKDLANRCQELELSQQFALKEVNSLLQKFGKQMTITREREHEKLKVAFLHLRQEIEEDRNTCKLLEKQNKKLAKELTNANIAAADACKVIERERKARELLEEVCNELVLEIGEDKAEVEQLKQEQEKDRKRLETELKLMRMMALQRDNRVKENSSDMNIQLLDSESKECIPLPEARSKLEAFVEVSTVCNGERTRGDVDSKQAEQGRLFLKPFCLLELLSQRECQDVCFEIEGSPMAPSVSGAGCSGASATNQETEFSTAGTISNRDAGYHVDGEQETLIRDKQRGFISKTRRPRKSSRPLHSRRASDCEESTHINQALGNEFSEEKNIVFTHTEDRVKADMVSSMLYSFSKDDARSCIMRGSSLKRKQESAMHAEDMHAAGTWQEQSFSGGRDGYDHVHHANGNLDTLRSTGGRMMASAGTERDHIYVEPMNGAVNANDHNKLRQEIIGGQDGEAFTARRAMGRSNNNIEACSETMMKCTQGSTDVKKVCENAENIMLSSLDKVNMEGRVDSRDYETMKKLLPWLQTSARSLPLPLSPDAFSVFGGAMKRRVKACPLSQPSVQDEQSSLYSHAHTTEGGMAEVAGNQQPLACLKKNSLGAQLIRAIELEKETKPGKPSFWFSPLW